jgi:diaminopimelate epimerase
MASADVGPTPYDIEIFDEDGSLVGVCGFGTTCTAQYRPSQHGSHLVAFVAPYTTTLAPVGAQANSRTVASWFIPPGTFP